MDSNQWAAIESLFKQALDLPTAKRSAFLKQACEGNQQLYDEVVSLLEADSQPHDLLDGQAINAIDFDEILSFKKQKIGPYEIVREIGAGGMGTVYLAERAEGDFQQTVALKLIKPGMNSEAILKRFRSERQILARLDHPNIARLLDGGLTDEGLPYFTMEYVDGVAINEYCDGLRLAIDERLALFQTVCSAVQYAHQNLIVHRDLKPSNILITENGSVKLLDFGIAKVLATDEEAQPNFPTLTQTGAHILTPEYAAPEQVQLKAITTATDVYSLGIILYELLTGRRPYRLDSSSPAEVERIITTTDAEKPSTVVRKAQRAPEGDRGSDSDSDTLSKLRGTHPERLCKKLAGDLDNICLMALKKESGHRYQSAEQFSEDIRRYLVGLPVQARQDTYFYRTQKLLKRYRTAVAVAGTVLLIIAALVTFYTVQLKNERDRARLEAQKAEQVAGFLQSLFEASDPAQSKGETITAREMLDEGAGRIETELSAQPEVQATIMVVVGDVYRSLGLYPEAERHFKNALQIRLRIHGANHPEVANCYYHLAQLHHDNFDHTATEDAISKALAIQKSYFEDTSPEIARSLHLMAQTQYLRGKYEVADSIYQVILSRWNHENPLPEPDQAAILRDYAVVQVELGRFEDAEKLYREVLALNRKLYGEFHPEVAFDLHDLADSIRKQGDLKTAETFYRQALEMREKLFGASHPDVGETLNHLARLLYTKGDYENAEPLARRALEIRKQVYGEENVAVVASSGNLAGILKEQGELEEAEKLYRWNLATFHKLIGDKHPYYAAALNSVAGILLAKGTLNEAERLYRKSLKLHEELLPDRHFKLGYPLHGLGKTLLAKNEAQSAEPLLHDAHALFLENLPEDHWRIAEVRASLGKCLSSQNKLAEAEKYLLQSYIVLHYKYPERKRSLRQTEEELVHLYEKLGRPVAATGYRE